MNPHARNLLWLFGSCGVVIVAATSVSASRGPAPLTETDAQLVCQDFARDRLKAPASAAFQRLSASTVSLGSSGDYTVSSYVDAQNSFDANIRTRYRCTVTPQADRRWRLVTLDLN